MRQAGRLRLAVLTYASAVKHEIPCLAIAETPEDGRAAEDDDGVDDVEELGETSGENGVVACCCPEMLVCHGRLPEREGVCNPVCKQAACARVSTRVQTKRENQTHRGEKPSRSRRWQLVHPCFVVVEKEHPTDPKESQDRTVHKFPF